MNNVINSKTNRLNVKTFAAIQAVKYDLKATNETTLTRYRRKNSLRSPVNLKLCKRIQSSRKSYHENLKQKRKSKKRRQETLGVVLVVKKKKVSVHKKAEEATNIVLK